MTKIIILTILFIIIIFLAVILVRAARFTPVNQFVPSAEKIELNTERIVSHMQQMLRCKTISYNDSSFVDKEEFRKFQELLPKMYPNIHNNCEQKFLGVNGILYHWKGKNAGEETVLMAHYDVVPVEEDQWEKPAFDAILEDGILWGRGTLDTKGTVCGILEAAEQLIGEGFVPEHDIYIAFSGEEEVDGTTCPAMVDWLV